MIECNYRKSELVMENHDAEYPKVIDSLHLENLYDTARLYLYSKHCDQLFEPLNSDSDSIYYSYLPLRFDSLGLQNDTVAIYFEFTYMGRPVNEFRFKRFSYLMNGMAFNKVTGEKLYFTTGRNVTYSDRGSSSRFVNARKPEVLNFVKQNGSKIDSWFRDNLDNKKGEEKRKK